MKFERFNVQSARAHLNSKTVAPATPATPATRVSQSSRSSESSSPAYTATQFQQAIDRTSVDDLALAASYAMIKQRVEQDAIKDVETAWFALTDAKKIAVPVAEIELLKAMPADNPIQCLAWRDAFLKAIAHAKVTAGTAKVSLETESNLSAYAADTRSKHANIR